MLWLEDIKHTICLFVYTHIIAPIRIIGNKRHIYFNIWNINDYQRGQSSLESPNWHWKSFLIYYHFKLFVPDKLNAEKYPHSCCFYIPKCANWAHFMGHTVGPFHGLYHLLTLGNQFTLIHDCVFCYQNFKKSCDLFLVREKIWENQFAFGETNKKKKTVSRNFHWLNYIFSFDLAEKM